MTNSAPNPYLGSTPDSINPLHSCDVASLPLKMPALSSIISHLVTHHWGQPEPRADPTRLGGSCTVLHHGPGRCAPSWIVLDWKCPSVISPRSAHTAPHWPVLVSRQSDRRAPGDKALTPL